MVAIILHGTIELEKKKEFFDSLHNDFGQNIDISRIQLEVNGKYYMTDRQLNRDFFIRATQRESNELVLRDRTANFRWWSLKDDDRKLNSADVMAVISCLNQLDCSIMIPLAVVVAWWSWSWLANLYVT